VTPYDHAYVYCDYCGRFMDWDVAVAKYAGGVKAGPHYRTLVQRMAPHLAQARGARDLAALTACHQSLFDRYVTDCAPAFSPRIGDPAYRAAMLVRMAHAQAVRELDPECAAADAAVDAAVQGLVWDHDGTAPRAQPATFWRMYDAIVAADRIVKRQVAAHAEPAPDPDETPPELSAKMRDSIVVQAWITYVDEATGDELLQRTGMRPEYEDLPEPRLHDGACPHCGAARPAPEGARRGVCLACGFTIDLGTAAYCGHCGAPIRFPVGLATTRCTHCQAEARLMLENL
jgi:hypothetical protein